MPFFVRSAQRFFALPLPALFLLPLCFCSFERKHQRQFFAFDTVVDITIFASRDPSAAVDSLERAVRRLDSLLSISNPTGDVWKINHRPGPIVAVQPLTAAIARYCCEACDSTGGRFDVSVAPLKFLYGLESHQEGGGRVPASAELDSVKLFIGCGGWRVLGDTVLELKSGVTVDFGGIAKGYMLALTRDIFGKAGIKSYLVNLGGDLIAWGGKPGNAQWRIGIQDPRADTALLASMPVSNTCVFTSGDYERFFVREGVRYHHLFDPSTARPGRNNRSATVIGPDPVADDAAVKAAFLMDAAGALRYIAGRGMLGVMVDSAGAVWASAPLRGVLRFSSSLPVTYR